MRLVSSLAEETGAGCPVQAGGELISDRDSMFEESTP